MKKTNLLLLFILCLGLSCPGLAKNKVHQLKIKKIKKDANLSSSKFPLTYDKNWFVALNKKQQITYMDAINQLMAHMVGAKVASYDNSFIDYLIEKAYAATPRINLGHIYTGSFADYIANKDFGTLNKCSGGTRPCAIYTCMRKDASGNPSLCCGTTSTPNCVIEGNRAGNKELRRKFLADCAKSSSKNCQVANREMRATQEVEKWCNKSKKRKDLDACQKALSVIEKSGAPELPALAGAPTGENCDKVSRELVSRKEKSRSAASSSAQNNPFWQDMGQLARKVCGQSSSDLAKKMGVCNIKGSIAGKSSGNAPVTYKRDKDPDGYDSCIVDNSENIKSEYAPKKRKLANQLRKFERIHADSSGVVRDRTIGKTREQLATIERIESQQLKAMSDRFKKHGTCTITRKINVRDDVTPFEIKDLPANLLNKIKAGTSLSGKESNYFKAATGLSADQFKTAFCSPNSHQSFKKDSYNKLSFLKVRGDMSVDSIKRIADQAQQANQKMKACFKNLKSPQDSGCDFYDVKDPNVLRSASKDSPILAKNKESGKCYLVTKQKYENQSLGFDEETGKPIHSNVSRITIDDLNYGRTISSSANNFQHKNHLKEYRCQGDDKISTTYQEDELNGVDNTVDF